MRRAGMRIRVEGRGAGEGRERRKCAGWGGVCGCAVVRGAIMLAILVMDLTTRIMHIRTLETHFSLGP